MHFRKFIFRSVFDLIIRHDADRIERRKIELDSACPFKMRLSKYSSSVTEIRRAYRLGVSGYL